MIHAPMADPVSKAELKQKVQALAEKAPGLHWREIRRLDPVLFEEIKKRYGGLKKAFHRLGINVHMKGGGRQKGPYKWTNESILQHLKELVAGRDSIEVMEIYKAGSYLYKRTIQSFGSLEEALKQDPTLQNVKIIRREKGRKPVPVAKETRQMLENIWRGSFEAAEGGEPTPPEEVLLKTYIELYGSPEEAARFLNIPPDELRKRLPPPSGKD